MRLADPWAPARTIRWAQRLPGSRQSGSSAQDPLQIFGPLKPERGWHTNPRAASDEQFGHLVLAVESGLVEWRQARRVEGLGIGAEIEQRGKRSRLFLDDGEMQRSAPVVGAVHRPIEIGTRSATRVLMASTSPIATAEKMLWTEPCASR